MSYYFHIEQYFIDIDEFKLSSLSKYDIKKIQEFRDTLNSFMYENEQYEFITKWRSLKQNRDWDFRVFGISQVSVLHPMYKNSTKYNENYKFHRSEIERYSKLENRKRSFALSRLFKILKIPAITLLVFLLISSLVYFSGMPKGKFGRTPFETCDDRYIELDETMYSEVFSKIRKNENGEFMKIPGNVFEYQGYDEYRHNPEKFFYSDDYDPAEDSIRGVGKLVRSSFPGTDTEPDSDYVISMRWEYSPFRVESAHGSEPPYNDMIVPYIEIDGELIQEIDEEYFNWISKQKILIYNRESNKAVICQVGTPSLMNPVYLIDKSDVIGKATDITLDYLEYNGSSNLDIFWVNVDNPEEISTGPYLGHLSRDSNDGCSDLGGGILNLGGLGGIGGSLTADMSSMANLAVSLAYETKAQSQGNDGTMIYRMLTQQYAPGITGLARSCASAVSVIVRSSGVDPEFIQTAGVAPMKSYLNGPGSSKWQFIGSPRIEGLLPGDILFSTTSNHVWMYVGEEAVKSVYPNSNGNSVQASYNYIDYSKAYSAHIVRYNYNGSGYIAYRLVI